MHQPGEPRGRSGEAAHALPSAPFAPGTTIGAVTAIATGALPTASTPWIEARGAYRARCSSARGANVLQLTPRGGAPTLKPTPDATWGLHVVDANIALGNCS